MGLILNLTLAFRPSRKHMNSSASLWMWPKRILGPWRDWTDRSRDTMSPLIRKLSRSTWTKRIFFLCIKKVMTPQSASKDSQGWRSLSEKGIQLFSEHMCVLIFRAVCNTITILLIVMFGAERVNFLFFFSYTWFTMEALMDTWSNLEKIIEVCLFIVWILPLLSSLLCPYMGIQDLCHRAVK